MMTSLLRRDSLVIVLLTLNDVMIQFSLLLATIHWLTMLSYNANQHRGSEHQDTN